MKIRLLLISCIVCSLFGYSQKEEDDFSMRLRQKQEMEYEAALIEASRHVMLGNTSEAMNVYMQCLNLNPKSTASMYGMARIFLNNKDYDAATKLMSQAVSLNPQNEWYSLFLLQLYKQKRLYSKAEIVCKNLINQNDTKLDYQYELLDIYTNAGKYSQAEKLISFIEKRWGNSYELTEEKIKLSLNRKKTDKAISQLNNLIKEMPTEERYYLVLIDIYKQVGKTDLAISTTQKYIDTFADDEMRIDLFWMYYNKPDTLSAIKELRSIISNKSIVFEQKVTLLNTLSKENKIQSLAMYQEEFTSELLSQNPDNVEILMSRANILLQKNKASEAKELLYKVQTKDKSNGDAIEKLLSIELSENNWTAVYSLCKSSLPYFPANANLYFYAGVAALQIEKYDEAVNNLLSGAPYSPTKEMKGTFYQYLGEAYFKLKDFNKCYYFFDKSVSFNPYDPITLNNYSYYLSLQKDSLPKALEMTKLSNKLKPNDATFLDTYAWVLFKMGKYQEAKVKIEDAIKNGGNSSGEIIEHYGDILYKTNDESQALEHWIKAKGMGVNSDILNKKIQTKTYIETIE